VEDKDLTQLIATLPAELTAILPQLGVAAQAKGYRLFLVGGVVRDLLLGRPAGDADIIVLGDAIDLAKSLSPSLGKLTIHPAFGTASIILGNTRLDLASARTENYAHPGALPTICLGTLKDDLRRRDFTVNTLAVSLNATDYGRLIDDHGGQGDLRAHLIRALHEHSFADDPTRIWRAVRYEQRLGFNIEPNTLSWLAMGIMGLKNITGNRVWHELAGVLREDAPEKALVRLSKLGALRQIHPILRADSWLAEKCQATRALGTQSIPVYLALLTYRLKNSEAEVLADYLHLSKPLRRVLQNTHDIKVKLPVLGRYGLKSSTIYQMLHGYAPESLETNLVASTSPQARRNIMFYQNKLRKIKVSLKGSDLIKLGVPLGPHIGELLQRLLESRLDGQVTCRADELSLAKTIAACYTPQPS